MGIAPDTMEYPLRIQRAIPLAIKTFDCPLNPNDPIPRVKIISLQKLKAEGRLEETKIFLGWEYNTRLLTISLSHDKYNNWANNMNKILS